MHRCVRSLHSHTYNFEVTSLGCVRRGPALLYMGVVSLSTGGLVGRGGGRRREFTMSRSRAACVGRAPCHSRRVAQAPESLGVRAKSAERCDVDHCVSSILDSNLLQVLKFIYYTLYYSPRFLPHIDAPGSNKKIILATRTQAKKTQGGRRWQPSSSTKNSQRSGADLRPSKPASILRRKDFWPQGEPLAGRQTL